jgi:hypothetical protein
LLTAINIKAPVAIQISSSIKKVYFIFIHIIDNIGILKIIKTRRELSGLDNEKDLIVCDSPNLFERIRGRNNKTPRLEIGH